MKPLVVVSGTVVLALVAWVALRGERAAPARSALERGAEEVAQDSSPAPLAALDGGDDSARREEVPAAAPQRVRVTLGTAEAVEIELPALGAVDADAARRRAADLAESSVRILLEVAHPEARFQPLAKVRLLSDGALVREARRVEVRPGYFDLDDLAPGAYALEIEDPRFEPLTLEGLAPGSVATARLVGCAAVRLQVQDAATGAPLSSFRLTTRARTIDAAFLDEAPLTLLELGDAPPADGRFGDLLPQKQALVIEAPGYARTTIELAELTCGAEPELVARLERAARLSGRFVRALDGSPVADARVRLVFTGERHSLETSQLYLIGPDGRLHFDASAETRTDADGRFALDELGPGTYELRGEAGAYGDATLGPLVLQAGDERDDLELVVRGLAGWRGRLLVPEGVDYAGLRLAVAPASGARGRTLDRERGAWLVPDAEGHFEGVDLPHGPCEVRLVTDDPGAHLGTTQAQRSLTLCELPQVVLTADAVLERDADARRGWPGLVSVRVRDGERPLPGVTVQLWALEGARVVAGATTGDDGAAALAGVDPGTYALRLRSEWTYDPRLTVTVRWNEAQSLSIVCAPRKHVVEVMDLGGHARANEAVTITAPPAVQQRVVTTDAEGRLELELPLGAYAFCAGATHDAARAQPVRWTAGGALPAVVRLP
ncbi:MAG: carboxypeptidase regulatory-like domain-containing protein [Planctomycetes bacterium]|nr:carboxypeptidase regulatory-like domain-containing protein [Planctomycetota bacterium]